MLLVSCPSVKDNITIYGSCVSGTEIKGNIRNAWGFAESDIYLLYNGKPVSDSTTIENGIDHAIPRLVGGKGGFGSLLRTFGKRIKKSTNGVMSRSQRKAAEKDKWAKYVEEMDKAASRTRTRGK
jgi:hypothetical protein